MIESYADDDEHAREGSDAPSHHYEEGRRRMNTLGIGHSPQVGGNPRRSSLIERVDVSILNHPTPTHVEDDSMLELEEEIEWDRLDRAERKVIMSVDILDPYSYGDLTGTSRIEAQDC